MSSLTRRVNSNGDIESQRDRDQGFTLIEVVVAMAILGVLATVGLALFVQGMQTASAMQNRQIAITIANQAMEVVAAQSISKNPTTNVSQLYTGRARAAVVAHWAANAEASGVSETYPAWDPTAGATSTALLPLTSSSTLSGTRFSTETVIGTCFQPQAGGDCRRIDGVPTAPSMAPAGYAALVRVVVTVRWTAGQSCADGSCFYETATLIDTNSDLEWNTDD